MSANYTSRHGIVARADYDLYMMFTDMRRIVEMLPADKREGVTADFDSVRAVVQGVNIGVRVVQRHPYDMIEIADDGAPFHFRVILHFDRFAEAGKTDFWVELEAELNMMLKMMIGNKIQGALDKAVEALVAVSEGRIPEGVDPKDIPFDR